MFTLVISTIFIIFLGKIYLASWSLLIMLLSLFYSSNLRSSIVVQQLEPNIDTLEDAANYLPKVYIPMFNFMGPDGYLYVYEDILSPEVFAKV